MVWQSSFFELNRHEKGNEYAVSGKKARQCLKSCQILVQKKKRRKMYKRNAPYLARQEMGIMELDTNFLSDRDAALSPEDKLCAAISMNRHLRDQQAPCLFVPLNV